MLKVSIITVCYNANKTIERTILSVLKQTYYNVEYIIIDGKSTDSTFDIVSEYYLRASNGEYPGKIIRAYSEPDRGIYDAMNKGIQLATGEIIGIINADDWYEVDAIDKIVRALDIDSCDMLKLFYGHMMVHTARESYLQEASELNDDILSDMIIGHPTCFVTRSVYKRIGCFNEEYSIAADYDFIIRCYIGGVKFIPVNYCIANFSCGGVSTTSPLKCAIETAKICLKYIDYAHNPQRVVERRLKSLANACVMCVSRKDISMLLGSERCVIFGNGIRGNNLEKIFIMNGIRVDFFVDNDRSKWSEKTFSPELLRDYDGTVIVAMDNHINDVFQQITDYGNRCLNIVCLDDLRNVALERLKQDNPDVLQCINQFEEYKP